MTDPKDAQRLQLEADLTSFRILELRLAPVVGDFDVAHLQKIHRRIFQDLPSVGFSDVKPGEFRPPVVAFQSLATLCNLPVLRKNLRIVASTQRSSGG